MTVQHNSLTGNNLHGTRIPSSATNRNPAYAGEAVLDGSELAIASGTGPNSWLKFQSVGPNQAHSFEWCLGLTNYTPPSQVTVDTAALLFAPITADQADNSANEGFQILETWSTSTDFVVNGAIDITPQIQRKGSGCYVFVLGGLNGYGNFAAADNLRLGSIVAIPNNAIELFEFSAMFNADIGNVGMASTWNNVNGFEVLNPLAQAILRVENI